MTMRRKQKLAMTAGALLVSGLMLTGYHGLAWVGASRYNAALDAVDLAAAAMHDPPHGDFARALMLQRDGAYQDALDLYVGLLASTNPSLHNAVRFNMANIYMSWAADARSAGRAEVAMPLLEMAKQSYRDLLLREDQFWPARYNLERALQLQPDGEEIDPHAQGMPERSPRALGTMDAHQELP